MAPYAELIGDPVAHSKSPIIHHFWLRSLGLRGEYRLTRVPRGGIKEHLRCRQSDPEWRGCNVTAPLKEAALPLASYVAFRSFSIGAINCLVPKSGRIVGHNTDLHGIAAALGDKPLTGKTAAIIGSGGAARAAVCYFARKKARLVRVLARDPEKATPIRDQAVLDTRIEILAIEDAEQAFRSAAAIVNASPLGSSHGKPAPGYLLDALSAARPDGTVLDMNYDPLDTPLLGTARDLGMGCVDGLAMLIGQARGAFRLFFGPEPPTGQETELRRLIVS